MTKWLLAYDIADDKRLRRVAKVLEHKALRVQKSVFLFDGTRAQVRDIVATAMDCMDVSRDILDAWQILPNTRTTTAVTDQPVDGYVNVLIITPHTTIALEQTPS